MENNQCHTAANEPLVMDKGYRIIQIHPTLQCNLTCLHCYSSSAPRLKKQLSPAMINDFLAEAYQQGYNAISVSGGEPFIYSGLGQVLRYAKSLGYFTTVTTNGTLFKNNDANTAILQYIDLLAFSIDGSPEHHNYMRNHPKAFERLEEGIAIVQKHIDKYGFIHTLTSQTLSSLLWLANFASSKGGRLLQLHPLERAGRGVQMADAMALTEEDLYRIYILSHYLKQKYEGEMLIELDLLHRDQILQSPGSIYAQHNQTTYHRITDYLRELILDEHGNLLPISHGFSTDYAIGNLFDGRCLNSMTADFFKQTQPQLQQLFNNTYQEVADQQAHELLNWAELIVNNSNIKIRA
jgi:sulfatase maturation enzyme AslB (radical SAM superfamily)